MRLFRFFNLCAASVALCVATMFVAAFVAVARPAWRDPQAYLGRNRTPRSIFESRRMGLA